MPISNLNWYEAYAFCIWDGGFLPSEAEALYAAAGGAEQREYPWGSTDPGTSYQYAIWNCNYSANSSACMAVTPYGVAPVDTATLGIGAWGQMDLVGNVAQWSLDWGVGVWVDPCQDCASFAHVAGNSARMMRGGGAGPAIKDVLVSTSVSEGEATGRFAGIRCARTP
jgi:formylglycine-generating enzyme required for sulfatase activity